MESDAFKIPLRPNPSTLPNVLPTILHARSQAFNTSRKAFLLSLFKKACLIWSIHIMSQETAENCCSVDGAERFSSVLLTQLNAEWIKGSARAWTRSVIQTSATDYRVSPSVSCTYAGMHCLVFYPQSECSWDDWPLTSGSKQRNDHLLHKSDSNCIQNNNREILRHTSLKRCNMLWEIHE